jgi:putative sterol carrier protein
MININEPQDLLGLAVRNLFLPFLDNELFYKKIKNWNKVIVVEIKGLYPITISFEKGEIRIEYDESPKYDLKLILTLNAFTEIAEGKLGLFSAFFKGKIKVKKLYHIFTILKFKNILFPALKRATERKEEIIKEG